MNWTISHSGITSRWIRLALPWACLLALAMCGGYSLNTAMSGGPGAREAQPGIAAFVISAAPDNTVSESATEQALVDRCSWEYTLWIGVETHPIGC
jgi:hypothetical protein